MKKTIEKDGTVRIEKNANYYKLRETLKKSYIIHDYINDAKFSNAILKRIRENNLKCEIVIKKVLPYIFIDDKLELELLDIMTKDIYTLYSNGSVILEDLELTEEKIIKDFYSYEEIKSKLETLDIKAPNAHGYRFKRFNISYIAFKVPFTGLYFYKKDFDEIYNFLIEVKRDYIRVRDIESLSELYKNESIGTLLRTTYNVESINNPPFMELGTYIKKEDIKKIENKIKNLNEMSKAESVYKKFLILLNNSEYKMNKPKTEEMFLNYCIDSSNNRVRNFMNQHFEIYKQLCNETILFKELTDMTEDEQNTFSNKLINSMKGYVTGENETILMLKTFNEKYGLNGLVRLKKVKPKEEEEEEGVAPYDKEAFINIYIQILKIINTDKYIEELIGNYGLSAMLLFMYLQYCILWRRSDIVNQLPMPNLRLIEKHLNGKDFISWLREGNNFNEEMGRIICTDIEEKINRLSLRASKNKELFTCVISEHQHQTLGLLLCICEVNRVNDSKEKLITRHVSSSKYISERMKKHFDVNVEQILGEAFTNQIATKSYSQIIDKSAEEFGWFGYEIVQELRSHKSSDEKLSEITKVYLIKDITEASKEAFKNGVLGSIKYQVLSVIDENFKYLKRPEKIEKATNLKLTPLQIETSLKILQKNSVDIDEYLKSNIKNADDAKTLLKEIIYGKHYCKHLHTKCLVKAMDSSKGEICKIGIIENNDCKLNSRSGIGCPYLIAKHYFIYEFADKFSELLDNIENSKSKYDKIIHMNRLNQLYIPFILELQSEFGTEFVGHLIDVQRYNQVNRLMEGN